ncbi:MAG: MFS transporter, partial [Erysipelotrichaceae bacterium]|nr:MFS transporter [Erysipelotrichaceae bacterium]
IQPVYAKQSTGHEKSGTLTGCVLRYPVYSLILLGFALVFAAAAALATYLINIIHAHGGSDSLYGIAVFCMAASEMPVMAASDKLIKRFGSMKLIAAAGIFYVLRNTLIAASPNLGILLLGMAFQGVSFGLMTAVITVYVSQNLKKSDQVMGQTMICLMTTGVGSTIGNVLGGWMIDNMGMEALFSGCILITLLGAAIMISVCGADYLSVKIKAFKNRVFSAIG